MRSALGTTFWTTIVGVLTFTQVVSSDEPPKLDVDAVVTSLELVAEIDADATRQTLRLLADKVQSREVAGASRKALAERLAPLLKSLVERDAADPVRGDAILLAATLGTESGRDAALQLLKDDKAPLESRRRAAAALLFAGDARALDAIARPLTDAGESSRELKSALLAQLAQTDEPRVAVIVLGHYPRLDAELQPKAIELLTQRAAWSHALLDAIAKREIPVTAINANQVARLLAGKDESLKKRVVATWGLSLIHI